MGAGAAEIFSGPGAGLGLLESGGEIAARSPLQLFWRRIRRDRVAQVAGVFILLLILVAIFAPLVVKLFGLP
ncbi:MAG TPA: ABC transporter permease, partial [Solirubrobacteraceae bacterium]